MKNIVQQLKCSVEGDFNPTWRLFNALSAIVRPPTFHKAEPQYTESAKIVHSYTLGEVGLNTNVGTQVTCIESIQ